MKTGRLVLIGVVAALVASGQGVREVRASEVGQKTAVVRASKGAGVDFGSKHAIGHYRAEAGACVVTLMIADKAADDDAVIGAGSRVSMTIAPGRPARIESGDGTGLEIGCTPAAAAMTFKVIDRTGT
jgi:hypothetical protein